MAAQQFRVRTGLKSDANVTFSNLPTGSGVSNVIVLDAGANVVTRTTSQFVGDIGALSNTDIVAGDGINVGASGTTVTITLDTPSDITTTSTSTVNTSTHTHAIEFTSDASSISANTILAANSSGGLKVADLVTSANVTIGDGLSVGGNVAITGSLQVDGTLTYVNTTNLSVSDPLITLSEGLTGSPTNDQGLLINRGTSANVALVWDESATEFIFVETSSDGTATGSITISDYYNIHAGGATFDDTVTVSSTTSASNTSTGSVVVSGGIGVAENVYIGANVVVDGTTNSTNTTTGSIQTDGGIGVAKSVYVGENLTVVGTPIFGSNQESTRLADTITISSSSSGYLFQMPLSSYTGAEVLVKIKSSGTDHQIRKFLIAHSGSGAVDYIEYGSAGSAILCDFVAETTNGLNDNNGSSHMALKATNGAGVSLTFVFEAILLKA